MASDSQVLTLSALRIDFGIFKRTQPVVKTLSE